ncbi:MAG TPA: hypothetical protein VL326_24885 [Kofleriaceae bacterium]|jgi:hypothetical protein|nr:hypothetical protein [Kofleriaceae bacterium]
MKRALRIAAVLGAASVAACFTKPGAPHVGNGDGSVRDDGGVDDDGNHMIDARADARMIDAAVCTKDDFNDTQLAPCGTWGSPTTSGTTLSRASMQLDFTFSGTSASGSCSTMSPIFIGNGTSIHVLAFGNQLTSFGLTIENKLSNFIVNRPSGQYSWSLQCPPGSFNMNPGGLQMTFPPATWWQFKVTAPTSSTVRVALEMSPSGVTNSWTEFQSCSFAATPTSFADVTLTGSGSGTTTASFDDFNVKNCP